MTLGFSCGFDLYHAGVAVSYRNSKGTENLFFILMAIIQEVKLIYTHQVVIQLYLRKVL
jgi:hypothetical protein